MSTTTERDSPATEPASYQRFREHFAEALTAFRRNVEAELRGMTWSQIQALRALCAANRVPFAPADFTRLDTGDFVGWVGGRGYALPRSSGGTLYVGVDPAGVVTGVGGKGLNGC